MGPETFEAGVSLVGGQLVKPGSGGTAGKVIPVVAGDTTWLGVAAYDAEPATATGVDTVWAGGYPRIGADVPRPEVAVIWHGTPKIKFTGAANFGDLVYPAANGTVSTTVAAGRVVGQVVDPAGVSSGALGRVRLF
jgi:hypothetical protein